MVRSILIALSLLGTLTTPALAFRNLTEGQQVGSLALPGLGGATVQVGAGSEGRAALLLFWSTWSPRSLQALADFESLHREFSPLGLRVVAVNVESERPSADDLARATAALQAAGVTYGAALDQGLDVYAAWGVGAVPSAVLVGQGGEVLAALDGYSPSVQASLPGLVSSALGCSVTEQAQAFDKQPAVAVHASERSDEVSR